MKYVTERLRIEAGNHLASEEHGSLDSAGILYAAAEVIERQQLELEGLRRHVKAMHVDGDDAEPAPAPESKPKRRGRKPAAEKAAAEPAAPAPAQPTLPGATS